jgi:protein SCO1/2
MVAVAAVMTATAGAAGAGPAQEAGLPGNSLYQLPATLLTAEGTKIELSSLRGVPLLVTLFYSRCTSVCPLLTSQLQHIVSTLPERDRARMRVLMVSLDSARDTPADLRTFEAEHHIHGPGWVVALTSASEVRALAAALGIRYRELPDHTFSHSAVITVADRDGTPRGRSEQMSGTDAAFLETLRAVLARGDAAR